MFEASRIKKIFGKLPTSQGEERKELLSRLDKMGTIAIPMVADEVRLNKMVFADAEFIFEKLYKKDRLEIFIKGLAETRENIRELYKDTIIKLGKSGAVPALIDHLADEDHMIRKVSGDLVVELGDASMAPKVLPFLRHESKDVKKTAMDILSGLKAEKAAESIFILLDDDDSWIRRKAVEALCRMRNKAIMPRLLELAERENTPAFAKPVLDAAGEICGPETAATVLKFITSEDLVVRQKATEATAKIGDASVVSDVMEYMRHSDVNIRRAAVDVLNGVNDPKTASALVKAVKDADWWVREIATDALSELGGGKISKMVKELLSDKDESVRRCAVEFYCRIKDPSAYESIVPLLADTDWWVREKAIMALGTMGDPRAVGHIGKLVNDDEVKWAIPKALMAIGDRAALKPLSVLMHNGQVRLRLEAIRALATIGGAGAIDYIKPMGLASDLEMREEALKILKNITGKIWLEDDLKKELANQKPGGATAQDERPVKQGAMLIEAILVIDLCKSTDMASAYGDNVVFRLMEDLNKIIAPLAQKAGLTYSKSTGDGFMLTFKSVKAATMVAIETLKQTVVHNKNSDKTKILNIRCAINLGETRVGANMDRLGNAVNMTFRVEPVQKKDIISTPEEANPEAMLSENRILLTQAAQMEIKDEQNYKASFLGFFELKGMNGLHKIYQLDSTETTQ